jgi:hypothetical protein
MAAPAVLAVPPCIYDAPIAPAELQHQGFGFPPSEFRFHWTYNGKPQHKQLYKINDDYFGMNFKPFNPTKYFSETERQKEFFEYARTPANLHPFTDAIMEMTRIGTSFPLGYECAVLQTQPLGMFCDVSSIASQLRMKLFCAFGMLSNFVNHTKVELIVRGGMALRLQLDQRSELISTAPDTDMDGLIVVDPSIGAAELDQFKTTFMRLLVLSIKNSIPPNMSLICATAAGDKDTIKLKLNTGIYGIKELGDFGFKHSDDEIVQMYKNPVPIMTSRGMKNVNGIWPMRVPVYPGILQCVWNFPHIQNMKKEYELVHGNLMSESRERHLFENDYTLDTYENLLISKFATKLEIAEQGYGGKKRTMKRRKRGGSTTEQIGAAAQMRAFLPRHSATRNALNHIVHHESKNRFHDANYRYSPATQSAINNAFRAISANPRVSRRTKKHMKIAKQKASTHRR